MQWADKVVDRQQQLSSKITFNNQNVLHAVCKQKHVAVNSDTVPVATRFKAWVCDRSLAGIAGPNPPRGHGCVSLVSVVCCQVDISASS
jgi:hypothetical protein